MSRTSDCRLRQERVLVPAGSRDWLGSSQASEPSAVSSLSSPAISLIHTLHGDLAIKTCISIPERSTRLSDALWRRIPAVHSLQGVGLVRAQKEEGGPSIDQSLVRYPGLMAVPGTIHL